MLHKENKFFTLYGWRCWQLGFNIIASFYGDGNYKCQQIEINVPFYTLVFDFNPSGEK